MKTHDEIHKQILEISARLTSARKSAGLTIRQAASPDLVGIPPNIIGYIEDGETAPTLHTLIHMAQVYGVSVCWLMTGQNPHFTEEHKAALMQSAQDKNIPMDEAADILDHLESLDQ